ncbi:hypothetical protein D3C72_2069520 [compost metagenome]
MPGFIGRKFERGLQLQDAGEAVFAQLPVADDAVAEGLKLQRFDPHGRGRGGQGIRSGDGARHIAESAGGVFVPDLLQGVCGLRRGGGSTGRKNREERDQADTDGLFHGAGVSVEEREAGLLRR